MTNNMKGFIQNSVNNVNCTWTAKEMHFWPNDPDILDDLNSTMTLEMLQDESQNRGGSKKDGKDKKGSDDVGK